MFLFLSTLSREDKQVAPSSSSSLTAESIQFSEKSRNRKCDSWNDLVMCPSSSVLFHKGWVKTRPFYCACFRICFLSGSSSNWSEINLQRPIKRLSDTNYKGSSLFQVLINSRLSGFHLIITFSCACHTQCLIGSTSSHFRNTREQKRAKTNEDKIIDWTFLSPISSLAARMMSLNVIRNVFTWLSFFHFYDGQDFSSQFLAGHKRQVKKTFCCHLIGSSPKF